MAKETEELLIYYLTQLKDTQEELGKAKKLNSKIWEELNGAENKIKLALKRCPICSVKPGTPTLCSTCYILQSVKVTPEMLEDD